VFTIVLKKIISWIAVVLFTLLVEIVEYTCVSSLLYTGYSVCMLCCVKTDGYWSLEDHVGWEEGGDDVLKL
jgi:hypothetical protein